MVRVVKAVTPLHAKPPVIGRAVAALHLDDGVVLDVVGQLATHPAVRADRINRLVRHHQPRFARGHQRAGGAGLHALAAGNAARGAHRIVKVEHDLRMLTTKGVADDIIHLLFAAGAHAAVALYARIKIDRDGRVRHVPLHLRARRKARQTHIELFRPHIEFRLARVALRRHIREQQLEHHFLRAQRARVVGGHLHALFRVAAARGRQRALAFDLHHARTAVPVRPHPLLVTKVRNLDAVLFCRLYDRLIRTADHISSVQLERNRHRRLLLFTYSVHSVPLKKPAKA